METRTLGEGGPSLSALGLGCNNFGMKLDADASGAVIAAALDAGITHFDTAEMYGDGLSETYLAAALGKHRDEVFIATKFLPRPQGEPYTPGALAKRITTATEESLRRLSTDRIDLLYQHFPDTEAPVEELLTTFDGLIQSGKVLQVAISNYRADQITDLVVKAEKNDHVRPCGVQEEWSLLSRRIEAEVVPAARAAGMGVVPYYPLASGLLTGKYSAGKAFPEGSRLATMSYFTPVATDENFARVERLSAFAETRGRTIVELAFGWLLAQDMVTSVIAGATSAEQVAANVAATSWALTAEELREVDDVLGGQLA